MFTEIMGIFEIAREEWLKKGDIKPWNNINISRGNRDRKVYKGNRKAKISEQGERSGSWAVKSVNGRKD